MKVWHFSDTHSQHSKLIIPDEIDIAIFSGDCSNPRDIYQSEQEILNFLEWYSHVKIPYKIFVAGNHDVAIEKKLITNKQIESKGLIYLENSSIEINVNNTGLDIPPTKIKIWGSPITPTFGYGWAFNRDRDKLNKLWQNIPDDTDIVVSHGPPKTILDLSYNVGGELEFCGCSALYKRMLVVQPQLCLFGHIHNNSGVINAGTRIVSGCKTIFSNGSVLTDGRFNYGLSSNGNVLNVNSK